MSDSDKIFDGLLVLQYQAGKKEAMNLLVNRHHKKICRHVHWYLHDFDLAKDIAQDCWKVVLKKIDTLKEPNLFGSWVLRIATRKSLDALKYKKREHQNNQEYRLSSIHTDESIENEIEIMKLKKALTALSTKQRQVLHLFYTEAYSLREISGILFISEGTVKSRLFHAREKLKKLMK